MNTNSVAPGGGGMQYLDPYRPSPGAEAAVKMIESFGKRDLEYVADNAARLAQEAS